MCYFTWYWQAVAISPVVEAAKHGQLSTMRKLLDGGVGSAEDQDKVNTWCVYVSVSDVLAVFCILCHV